VFPPARPRPETLARLGIDPARRVLLCQGSVRPYKGYGLAIRAARLLGPDYHLVVAGRPNDPAFGDELRREAAGLGNVTLLLTLQTEQEMSDLFAAADCYLLPYSKITGSGSLLTTCTLGRGFVASDLPYFRRAVEQEPQAGLCFPPGSAEGLAAAVREFFAGATDPRHRAARRLADRVPWDEVVRPVVDWFRAAFPGRLGAPAPVGASGG
jgi:glycosyltransferase involved in cell wall biosynthesis